ncbi:hypothetical protein BX600DRAFT_448090 [Xylariales sp. PMI_506]|nr:hypothetical protein BX600DRAFT_448090 [Xylariales sp. PMI_506]
MQWPRQGNIFQDFGKGLASRYHHVLTSCPGILPSEPTEPASIEARNLFSDPQSPTHSQSPKPCTYIQYSQSMLPIPCLLAFHSGPEQNSYSSLSVTEPSNNSWDWELLVQNYKPIALGNWLLTSVLLFLFLFIFVIFCYFSGGGLFGMDVLQVS